MLGRSARCLSLTMRCALVFTVALCPTVSGQDWRLLRESPTLFGPLPVVPSLDGDTLALSQHSSGVITSVEVHRRVLQPSSGGGTVVDWTTLEAVFAPPSGTGATYLAMDLDGDTLAISGQAVAGGAGEVTVFVRTGSDWTQQAILQDPDGGGFGSVDLEGETLAVLSASTTDPALHVFTRSGSSWSLDQSLAPPLTYRFGGALAFDGTTLVVSLTALGSSFSSAVAVFTGGPGGWSAPSVLMGTSVNPGSIGTLFGFSVDVDGSRVAVGAYANNDYLGSVHVFEHDGSAWQETVLLNSTAYLLGSSVCLTPLGVIGGGQSSIHQFEDLPSGWKEVHTTNTKLFFGSGVTGNGVTLVSDGSRIAAGLYGWTYNPVSSWVVFQLDRNPWADLGGATPAGSTTVELDVVAPLSPGSSMAVKLSGAQPFQPMLELISLGSTPVPALGGTFHAFPVTVQFFRSTDADGSWEDWVVWPAGLPSGIEITVQVLVQNPGGIPNLRLSNAVQVTTP